MKFRSRWLRSRPLHPDLQACPELQTPVAASGPVLVVLDGSADATALLDHATRMATLSSSSLHVLACGERLHVSPENLLLARANASTRHEQKALARCAGMIALSQHHLADDQSIVARVRELVVNLQIACIVFTGRGANGSRLVRPLTEVADELARLGHSVELIPVNPPCASRTARRMDRK